MTHIRNRAGTASETAQDKSARPLEARPDGNQGDVNKFAAHYQPRLHPELYITDAIVCAPLLFTH
jgi:hypothetical protein